VWVDNVPVWKFGQNGEIHTSVKATFYKGTLTVTDAFDTSLIGTRYNGFFDFVKDTHYNVLNEYQICSLSGACEWWCLHNDNGDLSTQYLALTTQTTVPVNTHVVVLEGNVTANDNGTILNATDMNLIKARDYTYTIDGDAKLFLINVL
jgi:hypothetical protein